MPRRTSENTFAKVRADHASETAEDYVEAVSDLVHRNGRCRVTDLAEVMGVTHVTVVRVIARLQEAGLVDTEPYRPIRLTAAGEELAAEARRRHEIVHAFLLAIGVPPGDAQRDSEGIEHHVGEATLTRMAAFVEAHEHRINADRATTDQTPADQTSADQTTADRKQRS